MTAVVEGQAEAEARSPAGWRLTPAGMLGRGFAFVILAVVLLLPAQAADFSSFCSLAAIYALMGLSLNVIVGYTGQLSLGHQGFLGLGAMVTANVVAQLNMPLYVGIATGVLAAVAVAVVLGLVALRITGLYLSLITLVFGSAITASLFALPSLSGNNSGVQLQRPAIVGSNGRWYLVCLAVLLIVYFLDYRLTVSKVGRALLAIKENERVAEAFGIGVTSYKLMAFAISGAIAGLAGGLYAFRSELFSEKDFQDPQGFQLALLFVVMCVVGGLGNRLGVVIAGAFFGLLNDLLDRLFYWQPVHDVVQHIPVLNGYYGPHPAALPGLIGAALLLQTLLFNPGGIGAQLKPVSRWMTGHKFELHPHEESGPGAVEGSSVRA